MYRLPFIALRYGDEDLIRLRLSDPVVHSRFSHLTNRMNINILKRVSNKIFISNGNFQNITYFF